MSSGEGGRGEGLREGWGGEGCFLGGAVGMDDGGGGRGGCGDGMGGRLRG